MEDLEANIMSAIPVLIGAFIGAVASIVATMLANRSSSKNKKSELLLNQKLIIDELIRETCINLMDSLNEYASAMHEVKAWIKLPGSPFAPLDNGESVEAQRRVETLSKRINNLSQRLDDDSIRDQIGAYLNQTGEIVHNGKPLTDETMKSLNTSMDLFFEVQDWLGMRIRNTYPPPT